ncbi:MAG: ATP-dependent Clp protease ATP-binding subunit ClpA [Gammaproteobacteria bacterium CG_4_10_14_0_8_um_filter_38_16]|nr:MAG: ATP-dependent Clp protease ATP-binding subunit ClpA [Gammaproteobacteria bacterium CG_4_10_14_0_8_um_filter_38_16]PJA03378.1 MAG: ATP-dependent Clp protease ATP-binding subunit ClpA [Gammaproteobacteria bacterium CG_4_10_14_0_2_um_filter_38_22]PJB11134.1 MAG: ATP-dependent Clp protease ATP-binding subunit ClpA [Gammaproteobacteria bacterium CG_4_9_14_3_um_filter_38_9]
MFSKSFELTLNSAYDRAREKKHEFITVEHLLLALVDNPEASEILLSCGANLDRLRAGLGIFVDETTPSVVNPAERDIQPTISFQRVLQRSIYQVQSAGQTEVTGAYALASIFGEPDSQAVYFLHQENVTRIDVMKFTTQGITKSPREEFNFESNHPLSQTDSPASMRESGSEENILEMYAINLNERAKSGQSDPLIGRSEEITRVIQTLCRRRKNNPLLVGEAGVGKTAIAEGLAKRIVDKAVPQALAYCTVYSLDLGVLLAGTKYRGDFEKRFKAVLKALRRQTGAIIFIDEIHNLVGAGSATGGTMDASNLIKPFLSSGELRCMGATTYDEFRNYFAKDAALLRRFQKIDIAESTPEDTLKILQGLKPKLEMYHGVRFSNKALDCAVTLSSRYMSDRHLPDKAIDIIDEAGAFQQLQTAKKKKQLIGAREIEEIVAKMAGIPIQQVTQSDRAMLQSLDRDLKQTVFGQDHAIDALSDAIKLSRAGLRHENKPIGCFLMTGPTGVGKTEICKQLAKSLNVELLRFDMSEYGEKHTVSRLIGAPPGYVGFDQGGLLTESVMKKPYSIVLLDEVEKAHPDMFNILLQVMDYGFLTDNNGRKADFRHVILMMTTNAGAESLEKVTVGFATDSQRDDNMVAIKHLFSPEFRNRLDAVLQFAYLNQETILKVVDKNIAELSAKLQEKNLTISLDDDARLWLAKHGYDKKMGARPMERLIQEKLKKPFAEELLFGKLSDGHEAHIHVSVNKNELVWEIEARSDVLV